MPWQVDYLTNEDAVTVTVSGPVTLEDFVGIHAAGIAMAREHDTRRILIDALGMIMAIPPTQLYGLPILLEEKGLTRGHKVAIVVTDHARPDENLSFLETVFYNRGFPLRVFTETPEALAWLKPGAPTSDAADRRTNEA